MLMLQAFEALTQMRNCDTDSSETYLEAKTNLTQQPPATAFVSVRRPKFQELYLCVLYNFHELICFVNLILVDSSELSIAQGREPGIIRGS